jgi:hypothetical protein
MSEEERGCYIGAFFEHLAMGPKGGNLAPSQLQYELINFIPALSMEEAKIAIPIIMKNHYQYLCSDPFEKMLQRFPEIPRYEDVSRALAEAEASPYDDRSRVDDITALVPSLSPQQLEEAAAWVCSITSPLDKMSAMDWMAGLLPMETRERMVAEALDAFRASDDRGRERWLFVLAPHLTAGQKPEFVAAALDAAMATNRRDALWMLVDHEYADPIIDVIADVGGQETLAAIATAIADAGAWQP